MESRTEYFFVYGSEQNVHAFINSWCLKHGFVLESWRAGGDKNEHSTSLTLNKPRLWQGEQRYKCNSNKIENVCIKLYEVVDENVIISVEKAADKIKIWLWIIIRVKKTNKRKIM